MRESHPHESAVGMDYYVSNADGIGGRLRERPEDFRVREIEHFDVESIDADPNAYPHVVCRVKLVDWDTNDFAARLSDALGISRERVSWAGTKDKRAVTTQLVSVRSIDPESIPAIRGATIEVVGRAGRALTFGDLAGNAFEITVSEPDHPERVDSITRELSAFAVGENIEAGDEGTDSLVGVPNYFGQQRFGSRRPITHEVGLAIVRRDWEGAVMAYVGRPYETEPEDTREARAFVENTRDWARSLERFPRRLGFERSMLHRLTESGDETPEAFQHALEAVPTNLQRLFVNAAQSYVFNRILSERLERGLPFERPVDGDVVCFVDRDAPQGLTIPDPGRSQQVTADRVDAFERHCRRGRAFVTAPLIGTDTDLSAGEPGEVERAVLDDLTILPGDFALPGTFASSGTRRAILVRTTIDVVGDSPIFSFSLPSGSYATVLLREYMKTGPLSL